VTSIGISAVYLVPGLSGLLQDEVEFASLMPFG
jgi:hypothetical protein